MKSLNNDLDDLESIEIINNYFPHTQDSQDLLIDAIEPFYSPSVPDNLENLIQLFPASLIKRKRIRNANGHLANLLKANGKLLKKEYLRCQLIRGHKRAIRNAMDNKIPIKTLNRVNLESQMQVEKWIVFQKFVKNNLILEKIALPKNGPKTDGVKKKSEEELSCAPKSFNNDFCFVYFMNEVIRESFWQYCDVLFCSMDPVELCSKFKAFCCNKSRIIWIAV